MKPARTQPDGTRRVKKGLPENVISDFQKAFEKLDLNALRDIGREIRRIGAPKTPNQDEVNASFWNLRMQMDKAGLLDLLGKHEDAIRPLIAIDAFPEGEFKWISREELENLVGRIRQSTTRLADLVEEMRAKALSAIRHPNSRRVIHGSGVIIYDSVLGAVNVHAPEQDPFRSVYDIISIWAGAFEAACGWLGEK
jgi:hypothetical protein